MEEKAGFFESILMGAKEVVLWVLEKLPNSPFSIPSNNLEWGMFGNGIALFLDLRAIFSDLTKIGLAVGVYYIYRWVLRLTKFD